MKDTKWSTENGGKSWAQWFVQLLDQSFNKFLERLDIWIEEQVAKAVLTFSKSKCEIKSTVYNFALNTIDDKLSESLNLGGNYILHNDDLDEEEARARLEKELFNYIISYRKFIQKMPSINWDDRKSILYQ